ncbi:uncharacterized protein DUF3795 [Hydrogenispora ethanolica]|uniref:Uncharacterized protein DUF3795 n=1 Tax=Hydrogenispora ethanolica TaxID=1082276 RepID=A0A4R1R9I9_HYDET|nr:DUF3795 domain-containing protein [Hydrogenispora ethanolica]TCL62383.1 uncharacterized protein DUF3795 [Hydrogenispora ethanolica]
MERKERKENGYCGLYCGACPVFMKTQNGQIEQLAAELGTPVVEVACFGCKSNQVAKWCRDDCPIKKCSQEKGHDYCIECDDYLCKDLMEFRDDPRYPYHTEIEAYLDQIRKEGTESWLNFMKIRWSCKNCHTPYDWFQQTCNRCGAAVAGYHKPES